MATLSKLCLFTHTRSLIMLLSTTFFTFIFPFKAQQCCAWIVLGTTSMFCLTPLRLLDVCKWIFVFSDWHMLCQRLTSCIINICSQRGWVYCFYCVFISHIVCLGLRFFVLCCYLFFFSTCSFLACLGFFCFLFL